MTNTEVYEAMIGWISNATGLTAIKSHQGGDRPDKPYIMVNQPTIREVRANECELSFTDVGEDVQATIGIETEWQFSVHCYGDDAVSPLHKMRNLYRIPGVLESIDPLTIHDIGPINSIPDFVQSHWENRAHCNLFVRGVASENALVDVIEEAPIEFP